MPSTPRSQSDEVELGPVARRIEQLLDHLRSSTDGPVWAQIEELVRALTDLYGAGLARAVDLAGEDVRDALSGDELVASLLLLHGLHPEDLAVRAERALAALAPSVRSRGGEVRIVAVDPETAAVLVSVTTSSGDGSAPAALADLVRSTLLDAVPDASRVEVDVEVDRGPTETPVHLSRKRAAAGAGP